jgi:hypothetical protein
MEDFLLYNVHPLENGCFLCDSNGEWGILDHRLTEVCRGTTHSRFFCEDSFGNYYGSDRTGDLIGYRPTGFDRFATLSFPDFAFNSLKLCADKRIGAFFGVLDNDPLRSIAGFARLTQDGVEAISSWTTLGECVVFDYRPTSLGNKFLADSDPGDMSCTQLLNSEDGSVAWQFEKPTRPLGALDRLLCREIVDFHDHRIVLSNYSRQEISTYRFERWVNVATSKSGEHFSIGTPIGGTKICTTVSGQPVCFAGAGATRNLYHIELNGSLPAVYKLIGQTNRFCDEIAFLSTTNQLVLYEHQGHYSNLCELQLIRL